MSEHHGSAGGPGSVAALAFDLGGTVFDWHTAVSRALERRAALRHVEGDWPAVTRTWRRSSAGTVAAGLPAELGRATVDMDDVLALTLVPTLEQHGVTGFTAEDRRELVLAWREMEAWPDMAKALARLRERFVVAPFTILRTALVVEASRRSGLSWDAVISCEMIGVYKTRPESYQTAARWLDLPADRIMLVSTHNDDIDAAQVNGFRTAFVRRPDEWGGTPSPDAEPSAASEVVVDDLHDLARHFGLTP